jgi:NADPH:quinone reductase-like Zn-dependent oxidoreductase
VLIAVAAAGVNNTDINTRVGWYSKGDNDADDASWTGEALGFPRIQGIDVCGRIVAVGTGVDPARIGERVIIEPCLTEAGGEMRTPPWFLGSECDGGFAQFCAVAARHAYVVNSDLSDVALASFPCSYSTAENMLTRTDLRSGETVLITGASGGVGSAAVQLAKARGAHVVAVTSAAKAQSLLDLGARTSVDRAAD